MSTTEYHVQLWKSDVDSLTGAKTLHIAFPLVQAKDVITNNKLRQTTIPQETLEDILANIGDLAFQDREKDASTSTKGIVQLTNSLESESENTGN